MKKTLKRILVPLLKLVHKNSIYYIKDYLHLRRLETGPGELQWRILTIQKLKQPVTGNFRRAVIRMIPGD